VGIQQQQQQYSLMMMQRAQMANMQGNNMLGAGNRTRIVGMSKGDIRGDGEQKRMDSFDFSGMRAAALSTLDTNMPRPVPASQLSQSYAVTRSSSSSSASSGCTTVRNPLPICGWRSVE
jgi:hypothetical protein